MQHRATRGRRCNEETMDVGTPSLRQRSLQGVPVAWRLEHSRFYEYAISGRQSGRHNLGQWSGQSKCSGMKRWISPKGIKGEKYPFYPQVRLLPSLRLYWHVSKGVPCKSPPRVGGARREHTVVSRSPPIADSRIFLLISLVHHTAFGVCLRGPRPPAREVQLL